MVRLRNSIYDRIDSPEPISSRGTYLLKKLAKSVTSQIDEQGKDVFEGSTYAAINDFRKFYSENVDTFYQKGIIETLRPRTESGAINPELLASRLLAGGKGSVTTYQTLKNFFKAPQAVQDMNRLFRDHLIDAGTDQATGLIKMEDMAQAVVKLEPEIVKEVYGVAKDKLLSMVRASQLGQRGVEAQNVRFIGGTQSGVEAAELKKLIDSGKFDSTALRKLQQSGNQLRVQYANSIRKAVAENDLGVIEAAPETFVQNYLANPGVKMSEVKDVMGSIYRQGNADVIGDVRRAYLGQIVSESAKRGKDTTQIASQAKGAHLLELDPQSLSLFLKEPNNRARATEILGHDQFQAFQDFAVAIAGKTQRDIGGLATGAFAGTSIGEKILGGKLSALGPVPKYMVLSYLLTSPRTTQFLRGAARLSPVDFDAAIKAAVLTPEFFRTIASDAPNADEARKMAVEIKLWAQQP